MTGKAKTRKTKKRGRRFAKVDPVRSATMRAVRSRATTAELRARSLISQLGGRASYNSPTLPGKPDIIFHSQRKAVFVHGCFWHGHSCPRGGRVPRTNRAYWVRKVASNRRRHRAAVRALRQLGWATVTLWECELKNAARVSRRIGLCLA